MYNCIVRTTWTWRRRPLIHVYYSSDGFVVERIDYRPRLRNTTYLFVRTRRAILLFASSPFRNASLEHWLRDFSANAIDRVRAHDETGRSVIDFAWTAGQRNAWRTGTYRYGAHAEVPFKTGRSEQFSYGKRDPVNAIVFVPFVIKITDTGNPSLSAEFVARFNAEFITRDIAFRPFLVRRKSPGFFRRYACVSATDRCRLKFPVLVVRFIHDEIGWRLDAIFVLLIPILYARRSGPVWKRRTASRTSRFSVLKTTQKRTLFFIVITLTQRRLPVFMASSMNRWNDVSWRRSPIEILSGSSFLS